MVSMTWNSADKGKNGFVFRSISRKGVAVVLSEKAVMAWKAAGLNLITSQRDSCKYS